MRILLGAFAALAIAASAAHADGVELTTINCAGDPGSALNATVDCAGGTATTMLVAFAPNEAISDLIDVDTIIDYFPQSGDVNTTANFWDFSNAHATGITVNPLRPSGSCGSYTDTWNAPGSGGAFGAVIKSPNWVRTGAGAYRTSPVAVARNQNLFGFQVLVNTPGAVEGGGSLGGCSIRTSVVLSQAVPQSLNGSPTTTLTRTSGGQVPTVVLNDRPVPAVRRAWAQLKSLYR
jgi:hypothetical protein